jgi:hypothetical protein
LTITTQTPGYDPREYNALPESIKATLTFEKFLWLSDLEKARLVQDETEPDTY